MACSLGFYGDGISFQVVLSQSFWLRVLPGGARLVQPRWMPERRILGGGRTCGVSFWPFLSSSSWWWLISSAFLSRTSSHKTTHANGYYGAWPGWAVSISVLPLTEPFLCSPTRPQNTTLQGVVRGLRGRWDNKENDSYTKVGQVFCVEDAAYEKVLN